MPRTKLDFTNSQGNSLSGALETPDANHPIVAYAIFAHCFTCGKDIAAASRISRALAARGIAVLRFDFTGLGNSDGDFANTNFSSNVDDLVAAANYLEEKYQAPSLLIGHSLGGAAVLSAAPKLASVKAVATIGAPASADHVTHLFEDAIPTLESEGEATVKLGFREFTIKHQLLKDLNENASPEHISKLKRALIVFHSPIDNVVGISEAGKIFGAAKHPKSFVSLENADHFLSKAADAEYVAATLAAWATRYLDINESHVSHHQHLSSPQKLADGEVLVTELDKKFTRGLFTNDHQTVADEPTSFGGQNLGPTPYNLLLMGLGACTSMTLRSYAARKNIPLEDVDIKLVHERIHAEDCAECEDSRSGKIERINRYLTLKGDLTEEQRAGLLRIADKCPVHKTLESDPVITTHLTE